MYWKYAGTQYKRKFHAIQAANGDFGNISFHAFDESLTDINFKIEPSQSFEELLDERCFEIRDKFSYIKFFFSGGSDSTTVLNTFLRNKIYIDEIIVFRFSSNNNFDEDSNHEVNKYTLPWLKTNLPDKTKLSIQDWGSDYFFKLKTKNSWFDTRNTYCCREILIPNIRGNNFCNLFSGDSPEVYFDGKWKTNQFDTNGYAELSKFRNIEMFFHTPNLIIKQAHLLKKVCIEEGLKESSKDLVRRYLRDKPIAQEQFVKKDMNFSFEHLKDKLFLKNANQNFKDYFRYVLSTKINGIPLVNIPEGYKLFDKEL